MDKESKSHPASVLPGKDQAHSLYAGAAYYFFQMERAGEDRRTMARIALSIAGHAKDFPVSLTDILRLGWHRYQATLDLLCLAGSVDIAWDTGEMEKLHKFAKETPEDLLRKPSEFY